MNKHSNATDCVPWEHVSRRNVHGYCQPYDESGELRLSNTELILTNIVLQPNHYIDPLFFFSEELERVRD